MAPSGPVLVPTNLGIAYAVSNQNTPNTFVAHLADNRGQGVSGRTVRFYVLDRGEIGRATTDSRGYASLTIDLGVLPMGFHPRGLTAVFDGAGQHRGSQVRTRGNRDWHAGNDGWGSTFARVHGNRVDVASPRCLGSTV